MTIQTREQKDLKFTVLERAVLYARTSGDDTERDSLSDQLDICEGYAAGKQYQIVDRLQEDVSGVSGANWDAPKLNEALQMAQAGAFDVLIVRDVKRFSRDIEKAVTFDGQFNRHGVRVEYVWNPELNGRVDATTKLLKLIRFWEGESDRIDTVKRLYNGRKKALRQKQSVIVTGRPPYGYRVVQKSEDKTANTLEIVETEAAWVKRIFEWFTVERVSIYRIIERLREYEVPTPTEAKHRLSVRKTAGRCEWSRKSVRYVLSNEVYIGRFLYGKNTTRNKKTRMNSQIPDDLIKTPVVLPVPRIIDDVTFSISKTRLADMEKLKLHRTKREYLLQGRTFCGICGAPGSVDGKTVHNKNGTTTEYTYYFCTYLKRQHKNQRCTLPHFRGKQVDPVVWEWVKGLLLQEGEIEKTYRQHLEQAKKQNGEITDQLRQIEDDIASYTAELDSQLAALKDLPALAKRARAAINQDVERLETLLDRQETRRDKLQSELQSPDDIEAQFITLRQYKADLMTGVGTADTDFATRRAIIEALNVTVTMRVEGEQKFVDARAEFDDVKIVTLEVPGNGTPSCRCRPRQ